MCSNSHWRFTGQWTVSLCRRCDFSCYCHDEHPILYYECNSCSRAPNAVDTILSCHASFVQSASSMNDGSTLSRMTQFHSAPRRSRNSRVRVVLRIPLAIRLCYAEIKCLSFQKNERKKKTRRNSWTNANEKHVETPVRHRVWTSTVCESRPSAKKGRELLIRIDQ